MRKLLFYLITPILLVSCSVSRTKRQRSISHINNHHLILDKNFERIDTSGFNLKNSDTIKRNGEIIYRYRNVNDGYYSEKNARNEYMREFSPMYVSVNGKLITEFIEDDENFKDSIFEIHKDFYSNGIIKTKGIRCILGFNMGLWYEYNHKGKLKKTINYDKGYIFNTDDVLDYCVKNDIPLNNGHGVFHANIDKRKRDGKFVWDIDYNTGGMVIRVIVIDGKSGNVLLKKDYQAVE